MPFYILILQVVAGIKYNVVYESASGKVCTATWIEAEWESKLPLGTQISCKAKRYNGKVTLFLT